MAGKKGEALDSASSARSPGLGMGLRPGLEQEQGPYLDDTLREWA